MKRITSIALALVLALGFAQCKKENQLDNQMPEIPEGAVSITLDVNSQGGSRADVNGATGEVIFANGDVIYVASNGKYIGTLTHNGSTFAGNIFSATEGQILQFYYLGNKNPQETLEPGLSTSLTVNIGDQTGQLPVVSSGPSNEVYTEDNTAYTATLRNQCALVQFDVTTLMNVPSISISGLKNKVTVDLGTRIFTPSQEGDGIITFATTASGDMHRTGWAIMLPNGNMMEEGDVGTAFNTAKHLTGKRPALPVISANGYHAGENAVAMSVYPVGAINGIYTIAEGTKTYFAQGNLQYQASTNTWRFADNQYDIVGTQHIQGHYDGEPGGNVPGSDNHGISSDYSGWIDLFGWATSGWNNGNLYYHPWDYEDINSWDDGFGYGPYDGSTYGHDLTGSFANADWGVFNPISNGGNAPNMWHTTPEWNYVLNERTTASGIRYAKAQVNDVKGVILLPDNWNIALYEFSNVNGTYDENIVGLTDWNDIFEANGAVFLPAAGYRYSNNGADVNRRGVYWSSKGYYYGGGCLQMSNDGYISEDDVQLGYYGGSVRLVRKID